MELEFDADKDRMNQGKHGLSLADAAQLDLSASVILPDDRKDYGEERYRAYGFIDGRMYMLAFMMRGDTVRAISFRKANAREVKQHGTRR